MVEHGRKISNQLIVELQKIGLMFFHYEQDKREKEKYILDSLTFNIYAHQLEATMDKSIDTFNDTFGVDENGIILTEVSYEKITSQFKPIVESVLDAIVQEFSPLLDGVYLYGSIATGKAVKGTSDLDSVLVFKNKPSEELLERISTLEAKLSKKYETALRNIGLEVTDVTELCSEKEKYGGMCFMKHLCICLYGNDIAKDVPGFKPSKEVAQGFNGDIGQKLEIFRSKIDRTDMEAEIKKLSQSAAKKILRTGFSLVMPRTKSWTTNSQVCYDMFVKFYPEKAVEMKIALDWAQSGSSNKKSVIEFIDKFGQWINREFQQTISSH